MTARPAIRTDLIAQIDVECKPSRFSFTLDVYGSRHEVTQILLGETDVTSEFLEQVLEVLPEYE